MNSNDILYGPAAKSVLKFALPIAATGVLQQLFNSADVAVVGKFAGSNALAAVGANASVINLLINLFVGLSVGANVVISHLIGQKDYKDCRKAVQTSIAIALLSGAVLTVMGVAFARPILTALSTPEEILEEAILYLRIYFAGMPFVMLYNFCAAILRSKGDTRRPLIVLTISGVINVAFNLIFVIGLGMSVDGVAIATVIATAFSSLTLLYMLTKEDEHLRFRPRELRIDKGIARRIAFIGVPAGVQSMLFSFSNVLVQNSINSLGAKTVAAATTALNFEYYTYFLANSFSQAAISFIGQNYGAGRHERCGELARWCVILGTVTTGMLSAIFVALAEPLCYLYTSDAEVVALAVLRIYIITSTEFLNAIVEAMTGVLRAYNHSIVPTVICIAGICLLRIAWLYTAFAKWPTFGVLNAVYPVSWIATSAAMIIAFKRIKKGSK